jgi:hypothetical protein
MDRMEEHQRTTCANRADYDIMRVLFVAGQYARRIGCQPRRRLVRALIRLLILVPVMATADVVIELIDGRRIIVPVDKNEVQSIEFTASSGQGSQKSKIERERITGVIAGEQSSAPQIWRVGPKRALKYPSSAAKKAQNGDIVEIDSGTYHNDYATWSQNDITIRGIGGLAHLKSKGLIPNRKAIWILKGNNIVIENVEFSGAAVKDGNGAGIRHQGGDLTLRNTFFHDNEFSMLSGTLPDSNIEVISSRFWFQKRKNRFSHGIYIGKAHRLTLIGNHFKGTDQGHQVKSRALANHILYNRIEDMPGGNSSRLIDLPNCGLSFIIGNDLQQAATTENSTAIGYGHEGCQNRTAAQMKLYVINNTFVNEAKSGTLVDNRGGGAALVSNNLFFGRGHLLTGDGEENHNVRAKLADRSQHRWAAPPGSSAINGAAKLPKADGVSLIPTMEFDPPIGTRKRQRYGELDVGSREALP